MVSPFGVNTTSIERRLLNPPEEHGDVRRCNVDLSGSSGESLSVTTGSEGDSFSTSLGKTKDGVPRGLFPLTAEEQHVYEYKLASTEMHAGRKVYRDPGGKCALSASPAKALPPVACARLTPPFGGERCGRK
jgi:hypothetical protein